MNTNPVSINYRIIDNENKNKIQINNNKYQSINKNITTYKYNNIENENKIKLNEKGINNYNYEEKNKPNLITNKYNLYDNEYFEKRKNENIEKNKNDNNQGMNTNIVVSKYKSLQLFETKKNRQHATPDKGYMAL